MSAADTKDSLDDVTPGLDEVHIDKPTVDDDNDLALKGMGLLLNNNWDESRQLFDKHKSASTVMHYGGAFVNYVQAIMALEEEKMSAAKAGFEEVEKRCRANLNQFKKMKKKAGKAGQPAGDAAGQEERWMSQIIVADSLLFQAVLTFMNQDIPSYMKGGWLLRKSWKIYEKVYKELSQHFDDSKRNGKVKVQVEQTDILDQDEADEAVANGKPADKPPAETPKATCDDQLPVVELITRDTLSRLLGAVSFGYGLFQIALSLLPEKVLKLIEFLGFHTDKDTGIKALEFSMESKDMRAPLAMLSMLWYNVLMKPFIKANFDDEEMKDIVSLIDRFQELYPQSAFFLFFKGRVCRLQKDIDGALVEYHKAKDHCEGLLELKNGALFEIAWCNLMKLNYDVSQVIFSALLMDSKWSKCFYTYILALCAGSKGQIILATEMMKTVPTLVKKKTNQIEAFISRRAQQFKKLELTDTNCELLIIELIYMWNNLPQCGKEECEKMLAVCGAVEEKKFFHVRSLIEGALYRQLGDYEFSDQCFKEALARHEGLKYDYHIAAHALFERGLYCIQTEEGKEEGRKMLLKAKDGFKEYDFENRLNVRIRVVLKSLEAPK